MKDNIKLHRCVIVMILHFKLNIPVNQNFGFYWNNCVVPNHDFLDHAVKKKTTKPPFKIHWNGLQYKDRPDLYHYSFTTDILSTSLCNAAATFYFFPVLTVLWLSRSMVMIPDEVRERRGLGQLVHLSFKIFQFLRLIRSYDLGRYIFNYALLCSFQIPWLSAPVPFNNSQHDRKDIFQYSGQQMLFVWRTGSMCGALLVGTLLEVRLSADCSVAESGIFSWWWWRH